MTAQVTAQVNTPAPRVFAVQQPTGRDPDTGHVVPTMDLTPAAQYGRLVFLLRHAQNPFRDLQATATLVRSALEAENYGPGDYLLLVGNPVLIGLVSAVASDLCGQWSALQWSRRDRQYIPVTVNLDQLDPAAPRA